MDRTYVHHMRNFRDKVNEHSNHNGISPHGTNSCTCGVVPSVEILKYTQARQYGLAVGDPQAVSAGYVARQLPGLLREKQYDLGHINKVFAAQWVSGRQVSFGTKCNQVRIVNIVTEVTCNAD